VADRASNPLSRLPKVDRVLEQPLVRDLPWTAALKKRAVTEELDDLRAKIRAGESVEVPDAEGIAWLACDTLAAWTGARPRRVINATGVVLHTNIGRAPLSAAAVQAMANAAGTCDLEIDLDSGARGSRFVHLRPFCAALLDAPDVHVVNNGAAALLLACTALATEGGVAISRGQMVEIGDGFRVAAMAAAGGARLFEVGSTNRTHFDDYVAALDAGASALLWVHLSNFDQSGFVHQVGLEQLAGLARERGVTLIADLGSGSLGAGLPAREPTIRDYLGQGADLVTCSGDKLLGGPQAGLMAGNAEAIQRCRRHPMARALRPDKTTLAALHATLAEHAREGVPRLPVHAMVGADTRALRERAHAILDALGWARDRVRETTATIGGGSLPGDTLASIGIAVPADKPNDAARALRMGELPVIGRVHEDELLLDLRTVAPEDDEALTAALRALGDGVE
jgi:L-seryl-tRNA(Ser) seleniumtransferase